MSWVGGWGVGESKSLTPTASQMAFATFYGVRAATCQHPVCDKRRCSVL
ncbi:Putative periplasmic protein [Enterobacter hormaechei]|nr:Putative periplasmic protein [Enterobacter hormaechei]